jgi:hypothetical protein
MNRIQTNVEMRKVKSGMFGEREHVIAEYDSLVYSTWTLEQVEKKKARREGSRVRVEGGRMMSGGRQIFSSITFANQS